MNAGKWEERTSPGAPERKLSTSSSAPATAWVESEAFSFKPTTPEVDHSQKALAGQ